MTKRSREPENNPKKDDESLKNENSNHNPNKSAKSAAVSTKEKKPKTQEEKAIAKANRADARRRERQEKFLNQRKEDEATRKEKEKDDAHGESHLKLKKLKQQENNSIPPQNIQNGHHDFIPFAFFNVPKPLPNDVNDLLKIVNKKVELLDEIIGFDFDDRMVLALKKAISTKNTTEISDAYARLGHSINSKGVIYDLFIKIAEPLRPLLTLLESANEKNLCPDADEESSIAPESP